MVNTVNSLEEIRESVNREEGSKLVVGSLGGGGYKPNPQLKDPPKVMQISKKTKNSA